MNTPSHAIINLALLLNRQPEAALPITLGAIAPDVSMFVMYGWAKLIAGQGESQIWGDTYWQPFWQNINHTFHSIPLIGLAIVLAHVAKWPTVEVFAWSMLLHCLGDFPVHHDDAHRHFFPFSDYRFISPISYWDPRHYGNWVATVEKLLVLASTLYLWPKVTHGVGRGLMVAVNVLYLSGFVFQLFQLWTRACGGSPCPPVASEEVQKLSG
jgi:hypothetical protein